VLALVAALAGTAVAGPDATSSAINKKKVKKLVKKEVAKQIADAEGPQGPRGPRGPQGQRGPAGSPAASVIQGSTGESLVTSAFSTDQFPPSGFTPVEADVPLDSNWQITPNATIRVRDLVGRLATAPGSAGGRSFNLLNVDTDEVLLTCVVVNAATTCDSGNASATLPPRTRYRMFLFSGSPAPGPSQGAAWSFRVVTP
jgi:hypothetical protein